MPDELRVFIGFDPREAVTYHVCCQSILDHTSADVAFHPVRGDRTDGSNDFTYARYLVPWRCGFRGVAIYLDGDVLVRADIRELATYIRMDRGVSVVKHDYLTKHPTKYLGAENRDYERKNWSSVIGWNCAYFPHRVLTPEFVAKQEGMYLRQLRWLRDEHIGELPPAWNRLVLEQEIEPDDRLRHFTIGAPCFEHYEHSPGADEWRETLARANLPIGLSGPFSFPDVR